MSQTRCNAVPGTAEDPRKLVQHLSPWIVRIGRLEKFPMLLDRRVLPDGSKLHWPQQDLSEMSNNL